MDRELFGWLLRIPESIAQFGQWLTQPIADVFPFPPLAIVSVGAISTILLFKAIRLFVGG